MNDAKPSWMLAGGLWLATTASLPAEDLPPPHPAVRPSLPVLVEPDGGAAAARQPDYCEAACPPYPTNSRSRRARAQEKYLGYPEEFLDAPLGAMLKHHMGTSIANGRAARMTLYQYDFVPGTDKLKPRGRAQVAKFAAWLSECPMLVFVEPSKDAPRLDEARRQAVLRQLAIGPCAVAPEQVVVGSYAGRGLEGVEAQAIDRNRLSQTSARGVGAGAAAGPPGSPGAAAGVEDATTADVR